MGALLFSFVVCLSPSLAFAAFIAVQCCGSGSGTAWIRIIFGKLDPDPHHFRKLDPDPHHFGKLDPDPHQSGKLDPDQNPNQSEKQDPNPQQSEKVEA
jgi:hypothetical protein